MNPSRLSKENFSGKTASIGRSRKSDICLSGLNISRHHANLDYDASGCLTVTDLDSRFGTFVNNVKIVAKTVSSGDLIRFGDIVTYRVQEWGLELVESPDGVPISLRNIAIGGQKKLIVENISFDVTGNTFLGILGPSGCGKSTLLKVLATYGTHRAGTIHFDYDSDVTQNREQYIEMLSYVPQEDVVYEYLTVEEHLRYSAKLQIDDMEKIEKTVQDLMEGIGLAAHRAKSASKISGGQKKRLSVAMEMMKNPRLLLLDEPTAGLDPATESRLMEKFRWLAQRGATVICTTHMLDNMDLFDELVVLGLQNGIGSIAFVGPPGKLLDYFGEKNLVRVYERLDRGEYPIWQGNDSSVMNSPNPDAVLNESSSRLGPISSGKDSESDLKKDFLLDVSPHRSAVPVKTQVSETFMVACRSFLRDRWLVGMALLQPIFLGLLACISQFNQSNVVPLLFLTVIITIWLGLNNSTRALVHERRQYLRDHLRGLTADSYLAAKFGFYLSLGMVQILLLYIVMLGTLWLTMSDSLIIAGFIDVSLLLCLVILPLTYLAGLGLGFLVSTLAKTEDAAVAALPLLILPQLLISTMAAGMVENRFEDADRMRPFFWIAPEGCTVEKGTYVGFGYGVLSLACYSRPATLALESSVKHLSALIVFVECFYLFVLALLTCRITCRVFQSRQIQWYTSGFR